MTLMQMSKLFDLMQEIAALDDEEMQLLGFELQNFHPNKADSLQFSIQSAFADNAQEVA